ncbi:hypothetical protein TTHERM_00305600 (macronuclear) [Tetrahymena thermophila SB210]|uniref:Uncharacterized protein n=1 Tax=Tetrahymena thermophila (strain SB210) TaxID=312017 RepID=I7MFY2_TETTS|nr:hypothetical protein TTHERM_00305600 [Tetrahymena thermophila SB210]EAS00787.2 hypothetical protein TTHERM_00305600 [Tetrahymena thermophila SB210]|eukprot:XP_001021032.2 hypothetical protein TTHERM_00305600 [Tetrahymena thermophila SB210]
MHQHPQFLQQQMQQFQIILPIYAQPQNNIFPTQTSFTRSLREINLIDKSELEKIQIFTVSIGNLNYNRQKDIDFYPNHLRNCNQLQYSQAQFEKKAQINQIQDKEDDVEEIKDDQIKSNDIINSGVQNSFRTLQKNGKINQDFNALSNSLKNNKGNQQVSLSNQQSLQNSQPQRMESPDKFKDSIIEQKRNNRLSRLNIIKEKVQQKIKEYKATCKLSQKQQKNQLLNLMQISQLNEQHSIQQQESANKKINKCSDLQENIDNDKVRHYNTRNCTAKKYNCSQQQNTNLKQDTKKRQSIIQKDDDGDLDAISPKLCKKVKKNSISNNKIIIEKKKKVSRSIQKQSLEQHAQNSKILSSCVSDNDQLTDGLQKNKNQKKNNMEPVNVVLNQEADRRITRSTAAAIKSQADQKEQQLQSNLQSNTQKQSTPKNQKQRNKLFKAVGVVEQVDKKQVSKKKKSINLQKQKKLINSTQQQQNNTRNRSAQQNLNQKSDTKQKKYQIKSEVYSNSSESDTKEKKTVTKKIQGIKKTQYVEDIGSKSKTQKKNLKENNKKLVASKIQEDEDQQDLNPLNDDDDDDLQISHQQNSQYLELEEDEESDYDFQDQGDRSQDESFIVESIHEQEIQDEEEQDDLDESSYLSDDIKQLEQEIDQEKYFQESLTDFYDYNEDDLEEEFNIQSGSGSESDSSSEMESSVSRFEQNIQPQIQSQNFFSSNINFNNQMQIPTIYISSDDSLMEIKLDQICNNQQKKQESFQSEEIPKLEINIENDLINQMSDYILCGHLENLKQMILQSKCDLLNLKCYNHDRLFANQYLYNNFFSTIIQFAVKQRTKQFKLEFPNYNMLQNFTDNLQIIPSEFEVFKIQIFEEQVEYIMDNKIICDFTDTCVYNPFSKVIRAFKGLYKKAIVNLAQISHLPRVMKDLQASEFSIKVQSSDIRGKEMLEFMNSFHFKDIKKMDVAFLNDRIKYSKSIPINLYKSEMGCLSQFIRFKEAVERNAYFHKTVEINTQEQNLSDSQWKYLTKYIRQKKDQNIFDGINFKIQYISTSIFKYLLKFIQKTENSFKNKYIIVSKDITIKYIEYQLILESKRSDLLIQLAQKINIFQRMHKFCLLGLENNPFLDISSTLKHFQNKIPRLPNLYQVHFEIPKVLDKKQSQRFGFILSQLKEVRHLTIQIVDKEKELISLYNYSVNLCNVFKGIQEMQSLKYLNISMINYINQYRYNSRSQKISNKIIEQISLLLQKCTNISELYMSFPILNQTQLKQLITPISNLSLNVLELNLVSLNVSYKTSTHTMYITNGRIHQYHYKYFSVEKLIMVMQKLSNVKNFDIFLNLNSQQVKKLKAFNKLQQGINSMSLHLQFDSAVMVFDFHQGKHYRVELNSFNIQNFFSNSNEICKNLIGIFLPLDNFMITKVNKFLFHNVNIISPDQNAFLIDSIKKCIEQLTEVSEINIILKMNQNIEIQSKFIEFLSDQIKKPKFAKLQKLSLEKLCDDAFKIQSIKEICEKLIQNKGKLNLSSIEYDFIANLSPKTVDFVIKRHMPQNFTIRTINSDKITIGQGILECCMMYLANFKNLDKASFAFENMYVDDLIMINVVQDIIASIKSCVDFKLILQNFRLNQQNLPIFKPISQYANLKQLQIIGNYDKRLKEVNGVINLERNSSSEEEDSDHQIALQDQKLQQDRFLIYLSEILRQSNTLTKFTYRPYIQGQKFSNFSMIRSIRNLGFCKSLKDFKIELEDAIKQHIFAELNNKLSKHYDKKRRICQIIKLMQAKQVLGKLKRIELFHEILQEFY